MMRKVSRAWCGALLATALLPPCGVALADSPLLTWGQLAGSAEHIVMGKVQSVGSGATPGSVVGTIAIEETFLGSLPPVIELHGDRLDPSQPNFQTGVRVLLFLRGAVAAAGASTATASEKDGGGSKKPRPGEPPAEGLEPVGGAAGVLEVPDSNLAATRTWLNTIFAAGADVGIPDLAPLFEQRDSPPQRVLAAVVLEEMRGRVTPTDESAIADMACDQGSRYWPAVHLWAQEVAGRRKILPARPCLEVQATASEDPGERLGAAEALGDLGDRRSVLVLVALLEQTASPGDDPEQADLDPSLANAAALALGKVRDPAAVPALAHAALAAPDFGVQSTAVHALGLVGGADALAALREIAKNHPTKDIRQQARHTAARLQGGRS